MAGSRAHNLSIVDSHIIIIIIIIIIIKKEHV